MGLKYYYEFQNDRTDTYRVEIHDANASPTPIEISPQGVGFILKYDGKSEDVFQPIVGSHCEFPVYNRSDYETSFNDFLDDILVNDEDRFTVAIYFDPDGTNDLYWCGVILGDQTEIEDQDTTASQRVTLFAADDVANLKYIDYTDNGTPYTGLERFSGHVLNCLNKTRTTDFWATDDVFMRFGNFFKTQSQSPVSDPTGSTIGFQHEEMYDANSFGVVQYPTAYDILYQICETLMLSLCLTNGAWTLIPRHRHPTSPTPGYATYKKSGPKISNNVLLGTGHEIATDATDSTKIRRLSGWTFSHLNPARVAKREYEFNGNVPVITAQVAESDFDTTTYEAAGDYIVPSGVALRMEAIVNLTQDGNSSRTGDERAIKYLVKIRLKCGSYYFDRPWTITTDPYDPFTLQDGTDMFTFLEYGATQGSWSTDSSNRFEIMLLTVDAKNGHTLPPFAWGWTTTGLPADSPGIEVLIDVDAYHADGTTSSLITSTALSEATMTIDNFQVFIGDLQGGDTLFFRAAADNNARDVIELEKALLGDNLGDVASRGSLRYMSDGSYTTNTWHQLDTTDYDFINTQLVKQHIYQRRENTSLMRGTCVYDTIFMLDWVTYEGRRYLPFAMSFRANYGEYDIDLFHVQENTGDVTAAEPERNDGQVPGGGTGVGVGLGFGLMATGGDGQARTHQLVALNRIQPAGTGGLSVRNAVGDSNRHAVTTVSLTGDRTVTLPDADVDYTGGSTGYVLTQQADGSWQPQAASGGGDEFVLLNASANVGNTGQNRYIPFGGNSTDTSSIQIYTEALMPFDGEWDQIAVVCASSPGTCTARIWEDGVEIASAAVSGTSVTLDFSGNTFTAPKKLAFSLHCSSPPGDVWVGASIKKS